MDSSTSGALTITQKASTTLMSVLLNSLLRAFQLHPHTWKWWRDVQVQKDICYGETNIKEHFLDIYQPKNPPEKSPVCLYIHGGGFSLLSKNTHWMAALYLARQGYTVFCIDYRLATTAPFPAAVQDTFTAATWIHKNAQKYGADPTQWIVSGESAGGNLSLGLMLASCFELGDSWAQKIFDLNIPIKAVLPICGFLQVSNPQRYTTKPKLSRFIKSRILAVSKRYLQGKRHPLADPILPLESKLQPKRPIPPIMSFVGVKDPVLDDTRRLEAVLKQRGIIHEVTYVPKGIHGFHLAIWRPRAIAAWQAQIRFINRFISFTDEQDDLVEQDTEEILG
jgi:acetyl esterase